MDMVHIGIKMDSYILESLRIIGLMDMESISGQMVIHIKVLLLIIKDMETEY